MATRQFQSTLPRGERLEDFKEGLIVPGFQSTLPRGERHPPGHTSECRHGISIHAPTRGATVVGKYGDYILCTFQSTLPRGERLYFVTGRKDDEDFNPRSHEGSDLKGFLHRSFLNYFNPRSHEGSDFALHPILP